MVDFTPVDHDPFASTYTTPEGNTIPRIRVTPVDHDPFAQADYVDPFTGATAATQKQYGELFSKIGSGILDWVRTPGEVMNRRVESGISDSDPRTQAQWSEARALDEAQAEAKMTNWGAGTALGMVGLGRLPGAAPSGSVGVAGARLPTPEAQAIIDLGAQEAARIRTRDVPGMPSPPSIEAYHGSPHDFSRFDISKIGTGEGAQTYGHGLYLAQNEKTALEYRDKLAPAFDEKAAYADPETGKRLRSAEQMVKEAEEEFARQNAAADAGRGNREAEYLARMNKNRAYNYLEQAQNDAQDRFPGKGHMYQVKITADPNAFLDFDAPISQSKANKSVWDRLPDEVKNAIDEVYDRDGRVPMSHALDTYTGGELLNVLRHHEVHEILPPEAGKSSWYSGETTEKRHIAEYLRSEHGVPGIKYLDSGSRGTSPHQIADMEARVASIRQTIEHYRSSDLPDLHKQDMIDKSTAEMKNWQGLIDKAKTIVPTRNYVVFDDALIHILRKYGLAGLSMVPPALAAQMQSRLTPVDHDPFKQ